MICKDFLFVWCQIRCQINLIPMAGNSVNRGAFLNLENVWRKALQEDKKVTVKINPVYDGISKRPTKLVIEYQTDGLSYFSTIINI